MLDEARRKIMESGRREGMAWMCPSREHVLGQVVRDGSGVRQLLLYRHAVYSHPSPLSRKERANATFVGTSSPQKARDLRPKGGGDDVEVMAVVEGYVCDVRCDICGRMRTWVPGEEAIKKLLERITIKDGTE